MICSQDPDDEARILLRSSAGKIQEGRKEVNSEKE
jgi:hypothetical protein